MADIQESSEERSLEEQSGDSLRESLRKRMRDGGPAEESPARRRRQFSPDQSEDPVSPLRECVSPRRYSWSSRSPSPPSHSDSSSPSDHSPSPPRDHSPPPEDKDPCPLPHPKPRKRRRKRKKHKRPRPSPYGIPAMYEDDLPPPPHASREATEEESKILRQENHHIRQYPGNLYIIPNIERTLREDAPRRHYYPRQDEIRTTNHWGQRKLLLSEIEFLTEYGDLSSTVVYAGAAPGAKNEYLAGLFPDHTFIFVDPNPFHPNLVEAARNNPQLHLKTAFFTDDMAQEYRDHHVLFISDIRTADPKVMNGEEVENAVAADNRMQFAWHLKMQPVASMLKFRIFWGKGTTRYLSGYSPEGKIYLPVWGRQTTTETRLVAVGDATYDYDNTKYEEQCFYFNTVTRVQYYEHPVDVSRVPGLCHCYDCAAEVHILSQWAKKFSDRWFIPLSPVPAGEVARPTAADITEQVTHMCLQLNEECAASGKRDLTILIGHNHHCSWFPPKLFDAEAGTVMDVEGEWPNELEFKDTREERGYEDLTQGGEVQAQCSSHDDHADDLASSGDFSHAEHPSEPLPDAASTL